MIDNIETAPGGAPASAYRPFDAREAAAYAAIHPPLAGTAIGAAAGLSAREVGDGNLNQVFLVTNGHVSVVLKQALPYVRLVGESWPLTCERNRCEREAYGVYARLVPDLVPRIYHGDDTLALFIMEDLSRLKIARGSLIDGDTYPRLARDVARFCAETAARTSDFYVDSGEKKRLVRHFSNPELCKITEDLVLTDPFHDAPSNAYEAELQPAVNTLWADQAAQDNVDRLRFAFMTRAESLVHGDLHTGSIMAGHDETKIMDAEFCFFGPMGFDVGMFIANLFLNAVGHLARQTTAGRGHAMARLADAAETWRVFDAQLHDLLAAAPVWRLSATSRRDLQRDVLRDAVGFAGAETIRRTIGLARVADLEGIADLPARMRAKRVTLAIGRALIRAHRDLDRFDDALALVRRACEEESW